VESHICQNRAEGTYGYVYAANGPLLGKGNLTCFTCDVTKNGMLTANGLVLTNAYMAGPQGERLIETNGSFNMPHYNVFWEGKLLGSFSGSSAIQTNWHFALNDWLGTKRVTTTSAGVNWTSIFSGPFGDYQSQSGPGTDPSEEHFTGKVRDANSNLDYFGARYYNSNLGRFMSPDWSKNPQGVPYAAFTNPQTLNLYGYVQNNPLSTTDPSGHSCDDPALCAAIRDAVANGWSIQDGWAAYGAAQQRGGAYVSEATKMQSGAAIPGTLPVDIVMGGFGLGKLFGGLLDELAGGVSSLFSGGAETADEIAAETPEINMGRQGKHIPGDNNFIPGRSELTADPAGLVKQAGTGEPVGNVPRGMPGFKERVDFGEVIGNYVDSSGAKTPTTKGMIVYGKDGVHIYPVRP
jgi:RHS repeat-associated protein